jgi:hypothetical protein
MPRSTDFPEVLAKLARRNALEISDIRWRSAVEKLITTLETILHNLESS